MAAIPMTLSDRQGHSRIASLLEWDCSYRNTPFTRYNRLICQTGCTTRLTTGCIV